MYAVILVDFDDNAIPWIEVLSDGYIDIKQAEQERYDFLVDNSSVSPQNCQVIHYELV